MDDETLQQAFVGKKSDYYREKFEVLSEKKTAWNWASFFLGVGWLFYRRMYGYGFVAGVLILIETVVEVFFNLPDSISNGISIGIWVSFGMLGNTAYKGFVESQLGKLKSLGLADEGLRALAEQRGNPSFLIGFLSMVVFGALLFSAVYLMLPAIELD